MIAAEIRFAGVLAAMLLATCWDASADKRIALVIGNSAYQNVPKPAKSGQRRTRRPSEVPEGVILAAGMAAITV
jgi:hypothetical protein